MQEDSYLIMKNNKKGSAGVWLAVLAGLFVLATVYVVVSKPYQMMYDKFYPELGAEEKVVMDKLDSGWTNFPIIFLLALIVGGIIRTLRQEPDTGGL